MNHDELIEQYLRLDEDGDYVVKTTPCPFLGSDNYCSIYDVRPSDCERFPYTDEDVLIKRPAIKASSSANRLLFVMFIAPLSLSVRLEKSITSCTCGRGSRPARCGTKPKSGKMVPGTSDCQTHSAVLD